MLYFEMLRSDADVLLRETSEYTKQERWVTARLLVRLAAVESRELYAPAGYSSMWDYCLGELQMSDDAAGRRLWAARKCREFPALFDALADDRIHLTAIHTLATYLRPDNVDELIGAATGRTKPQLRDWLACRFPRPAVPTVIQYLPATGALAVANNTVAPVSAPAPAAVSPRARDFELQTAPHAQSADSHALARVPVPSTCVNSSNSRVPLHNRAHVEPLNAEDVKLSFTMSRRVLARMQRAMDLLGTAVAPGDIAALFDRLLDIGLPALEKQKFAATDHPRAPGVQPPASPRSIPAHVKREVWRRDGGRCTFLNATGRRCECRRGLHYDHVQPVALGGQATLENLRLLCPKHNKLEADRRLGADLMNRMRGAARQHRAQRSEPEKRPPLKAPHEDDVRAGLTTLGFRFPEVSMGLSAAARLSPAASSEDRLRAALQILRPPAARTENLEPLEAT
jgi:hypothetical protein